MRHLTFGGIGCAFVLALLVAIGNGAVSAQESFVSQPGLKAAGSNNFNQYCIVCHGKDARGTGPLAATLSPKPADLTGLALRNGGEFPAQLVFDVIDGSKKIKGHGGGDMPEWGEAFKRSESLGKDGAKRRIEELVAYLESIQTK